MLLLLVGGLGLLLSGLKFKSREEVFRVGDFRATTTRERTFPAIRYAGLALMAAGAGLIIVQVDKSRRR